MNGNTSGKESPDKFVSRDVSDLRSQVATINEQIRNLERSIGDHKSESESKFVTHTDFANWKLNTLKWSVQLLQPLLVVALGAALGLFLSN